jgi:hypothetical protein
MLGAVCCSEWTSFRAHMNAHSATVVTEATLHIRPQIHSQRYPRLRQHPLDIGRGVNMGRTVESRERSNSKHTRAEHVIRVARQNIIRDTISFEFVWVIVGTGLQVSLRRV